MEQLLNQLKEVLQWELENERQLEMITIRKKALLEKLSPHIRADSYSTDYCNIRRTAKGNLSVRKKDHGLNAV